jgi:hypothetical protein
MNVSFDELRLSSFFVLSSLHSRHVQLQLLYLIKFKCRCDARRHVDLAELNVFQFRGPDQTRNAIAIVVLLSRDTSAISRLHGSAFRASGKQHWQALFCGLKCMQIPYSELFYLKTHWEFKVSFSLRFQINMPHSRLSLRLTSKMTTVKLLIHLVCTELCPQISKK